VFRSIACVLVVLAPLGARAQPSDISVRLDFSAPEGCIAGPELERAVSAQLGRTAFVPDPAELTADARIEAVDPAYRATVVLSTRAGEELGRRVLDSEGADCHSLDDALSVVLAMMLNVRREELDLPPPEPAPPPPDPWGLHISAAAGTILGLLPQPGLEVAIAIAVDRRASYDFGLELAFDWTPSVSIMEGRLRVLGGALRLFFDPILYVDRDLELALRFAISAGLLSARASRFALNREVLDVYLEGRAGLRFAVRLTDWLWLQGIGEIGGVPYRPTFAVLDPDGGTTELFTPLPVLGAFSLGLFVRTN
jgi:hypothetical protein